MRFYCISDYVINIISHVITFGVHDISDSVTEALEDGRSVPKPEWETTIKEVLLYSPGGQDQNNTRKFGINIILILLKVIVK